MTSWRTLTIRKLSDLHDVYKFSYRSYICTASRWRVAPQLQSIFSNLVEIGTIFSRLKVNRQKKPLCKLILGINFSFTPLEIAEERICGKSIKTAAIQGKTFNYWLFSTQEWNNPSSGFIFQEKFNIWSVLWICLFSWINKRQSHNTSNWPENKENLSMVLLNY